MMENNLNFLEQKLSKVGKLTGVKEILKAKLDEIHDELWCKFITKKGAKLANTAK